MPPPIPPFEPQIGIAPTARPPVQIPPTTSQSVHWDPGQHCDLGANTLPAGTLITPSYNYPTAYSKIVSETPRFTEPNGIEENVMTSGLSSGTISPTQTSTESAQPFRINTHYVPCTISADLHDISIPTTQLPAMAAETTIPYWEDETEIPDWAYQQRFPQGWWNGPHLKHVPISQLWPLIVICILLLVVAAWLAVPGFPFRPF